jgi:hypothetical protein
MSSCINDSLNFEAGVKIAEQIMHEKHSKLRRISRYLISRNRRKSAHHCYHYLRWVDDFIDDKNKSIELKLQFYEAQLNLVKSLSMNLKVSLNHPEEYFLYHFINYASEQGKSSLIDSLLIMLDTIYQDIWRLQNNGIFSEIDLQKYHAAQSKSLFIILNHFLLPDESQKYDDKFECLKSITALTFIKDLKADLDLGYINISTEDILRYQFDLNNLLNDDTLRKWYIDKFSAFRLNLAEEIKIVKRLPLRLKIFWFWMFPYCYHKMNRIEAYNFNPKRFEDRKFFIELQLYVKLAFSIIFTSFRAFIPSKFTS